MKLRRYSDKEKQIVKISGKVFFKEEYIV